MNHKILALVVLSILFFIVPVGVYGAPTIITSINTESNDYYPVLNLNSNITFTVVANESIVTYHWYTDDVNQGNNNPVLVESWDTKGYKNITVWATNANGNTQKIMWNPYVRQEMATSADEVPTINAASYENLLNEISLDEPDFESILDTTTDPYASLIGNIFFVILFGVPITMLWITQGSMLMPSVFALIFGSVLFAFLPATYASTAAALIVFSIMGLIYVIYKERK